MKRFPLLVTAFALSALAATHARADAITHWNQKSADFIADAKLGTPPAVRVMAVVQTAAEAAVDKATTSGASVDAAVAAAHRAAYAKLLPAQQALVDAAYAAALAGIADGTAKAKGIAAGEKAAAEVFAQRADDNAAAPAPYRPHTTAGAYVPTVAPAVPQWAQRKPWLMVSPAQFRPAAPPALTSAAWARDFDEVKTMGARQSTKRSPEQTEIARFWEYSLPAIYHGVLRSVAQQPGRDVQRNARLFAAAAQAMDDAMIAVFDAKYHHHFWRPVTAIRNADTDGHDATQRDPAWASLIEPPMHPEYPSGHSILAAALGAVVKADVGSATMPAFATSSPSAKGATRHWTHVDEFVREVSDSRVWAGIHFRSATQAGELMGRQIGELAAQRLGAPF